MTIEGLGLSNWIEMELFKEKDEGEGTDQRAEENQAKNEKSGHLSVVPKKPTELDLYSRRDGYLHQILKNQYELQKATNQFDNLGSCSGAVQPDVECKQLSWTLL